MDAITIAESMVSRFQKSDDPVVNASNEAGLCHSCETKLESGIEASKWIFRASEAMRAIYVHNIEIEGVDFNRASSKIRDLYEWWLKPCESVELQIEKVEGMGFVVANKGEYFRCKKRILEKLDSYNQRDFALEAFGDGFFDGAFDAAGGCQD